MSGLTLPVLDPEASSLEWAYALINAGFYVLPTRADDPKHAGSRLGKGWPAQSTLDPEMVTAWFAGSNDRLAIHCGRSGIVGVDVDHPDMIPDVLAKAIAVEAPPFQSTRPDVPGRGHYLFAQPSGRRIGNRPGDLGKTWGELRGTNGIILVGGEGREFLQTGAVPVLPPYVADLIPDVGDANATISDTELGRFVGEHTLAVFPRALDNVMRGFDKLVGEGGSRHNALLSAAGWATREIIRGRFDAKTAFTRLTDAFCAVMAEDRPGERVLTRQAAASEAYSITAWMVAQEWRPDALPAIAEEPGYEDYAIRAHQAAEQAELDDLMRRKRLNRTADRMLAAEDREPLAVLDLDAFLDAPQPDYLLPRALYRNGTAKVFGPPGGTKSFFLLDMALSLASGTPWHGMALEPAVVHYVMAEGQATNTARALAWFHHRGVSREAARGRFVAIPQGVLLTPEGIAGYLEQVRRDRPALVILDTKNRMMVGEENSASDVGVMVRTMDDIRRAADGAAVVLVDHTGISDTTRGRGSNAVEAAMDIEIRVQRDESGLGVAEVTRDKAAEPGARWSYRIERVEGVPGLRPGTPTPAVPVPADLSTFGSPLTLGRSTWWDLDQPPVPDEIVTCTEKGADAARDVFRVLRWVNDSEGIERARITEALIEGPRNWGKSTVTAALALMVRKGWADKPTQGRYMLGMTYQNQQ